MWSEKRFENAPRPLAGSVRMEDAYDDVTHEIFKLPQFQKCNPNPNIVSQLATDCCMGARVVVIFIQYDLMERNLNAFRDQVRGKQYCVNKVNDSIRCHLVSFHNCRVIDEQYWRPHKLVVETDHDLDVTSNGNVLSFQQSRNAASIG